MYNIDDLGDELKIEYPIVWKFKLITEDAEALRDAVEQVINKEVFMLVKSNKSSKGKFTSFNLAVQVESDEHRHDVYGRLKACDEIRIIL